MVMIAKETERMVLKIPASWSTSWVKQGTVQKFDSMTGHERIHPQPLLYRSLQTYFGAKIDDQDALDHL